VPAQLVLRPVVGSADRDREVGWLIRGCELVLGTTGLGSGTSDQDQAVLPFPTMSNVPPSPSYGRFDPVADPLVPQSVGEWAAKVAGAVLRNWQTLLMIQLIAALPGLLLGRVLQWISARPVTSAGFILYVGAAGGLIALTFALFAQGTSVFVVVRNAAGRPVPAGEALLFAARRALPLLGWGVLAGIMMFAGFVALILPGLYLLVVFGASLTGVVVIERGGIMRTFMLVNRRFWPTAGRLLLAIFAGLLYSVLANLVIIALTNPDTLAAALLSGVLYIPVSLASVGVAVVTYAELRHHENQATDTLNLAAEMEARRP
jgi:hypothetical protein